MATDSHVLDPHDHDTHGHGDGHHELQEDWSGGKNVFDVSYGKLMMWYFLLSDAFTFAGFLIAYGSIRFSSPSWPVPDFVFQTAPFNNLGLGHEVGLPLIFVTFMSFLLIISSVTMVRAVQEGHKENKNGVVFWMFLTVIGGAGFLGCQAWEWSNLIGVEHMTVTTNPFGTHTSSGEYLDESGNRSGETFDVGTSYLIHNIATEHHTEPGEEAEFHYTKTGDFPGALVDESGYIRRNFVLDDGTTGSQEFGPIAFGSLFFFITGFHGFHVLSGVAFLIIIMLNAASGVYVKRKNGYEMVEKIGLYWHFVDLVWVFVFLVFYLL